MSDAVVSPRVSVANMSVPVHKPDQGVTSWGTEATHELILETLRTESELPATGRDRFTGTAAEKKEKWLIYRSFVRQAVSNFEAALSVPNRSSSLLYYYAMLNLAKAELLLAGTIDVNDGFIHHGLSFSPSRTTAAVGDYLIVRGGVFAAIYERRFGLSLPNETRLDIETLISIVPEIATQATEAGFRIENRNMSALLQSFGGDARESWLMWAIEGFSIDHVGIEFSAALNASFEQTSRPANSLTAFAISRLWTTPFTYWQSRATASAMPRDRQPDIPTLQSLAGPELLRFVSNTTVERYDGWVCGGIDVAGKNYPFDPALARYALAFYASSLVRYRPSAFDPDVSPETAYLFDAVARECSLPMLQDSLSAIRGKTQVFMSGGSFRS